MRNYLSLDIYYLKNHPLYAPLLEPLFLAWEEGEVQGVTSGHPPWDPGPAQKEEDFLAVQDYPELLAGAKTLLAKLRELCTFFAFMWQKRFIFVIAPPGKR